MTNEKLTNRQAIGVLDGLWSNPLFGEAHRQAFEIGIMAIKALEQEPCEDMISRKDAIYLAEELKHDLPDDDRLADMVMAHNEGILEYQTQLSLLSSVNLQPKTGHWRHYEGMLICSECGTEFYDDIMEYCGDDVPKCCPNCGARMVDPQESEG